MLIPWAFVRDRDPDDPEEESSSTDGLLSTTGWLLSSRMIQAVLGWAGTVIIARTLTTEDFGKFTLIFTVLGLMSIITDLGVGRVAVKGMLSSPDPSRFAGAYLGLRTTLGLLGYVLVVTLVAVFYPDDGIVAATAIAAVVIVLSTPSSALDVVFQSRMRMATVSTSQALGNLVQVGFIAAIATAGGSVLLFVIPAVIAEIATLAVKYPRAMRLLRHRIGVDFAAWRRMLREALPIAMGMGIATLYYKVDAVMLSQLADFEAVGVYGVAYKFIDVVHFAATAVSVPLMTLLVRAWPGRMGDFRLAVRRSIALMALVAGAAAVGLVGFPEQLISLLYGAEYDGGASALRILILAETITLLATLAITVLVAVERHIWYPWIMLGGLLVNIAANLVLIPLYSFVGAALATLGSEVVVGLLLLVLVRRIPDIGPWRLLRVMLVIPILAVCLGLGWAADLFLPWVLAAALATLAYGALALASGLLSVAGIDVRTVLGRVGRSRR